MFLQASEISFNPVWIGIGIAVAGFLITAFGTIVIIIRWGISLESKASAQAEKLSTLIEEIKEARKKHEEHADDDTVHFHIATARQVEEKQDQRFKHIEKALDVINQKLDVIAQTS